MSEQYQPHENEICKQRRLREEHAVYVAKCRAQLIAEEQLHERAGTLTDVMREGYAYRIGFLDNSLLPYTVT